MEEMSFETREEAESWMEEEVDDPCVDNHRFAFLDDVEAVSEYEVQRDRGCCGSFDREVMVGSRNAIIGCNYGH